MTSAYDEATASRGASGPGSAADRELDKPGTAAGMEERPSSRTSLATGDPAGEEELLAASPSAEVSVLPGESLDEDPTSVREEETAVERERADDKDDRGTDLDYSTSSLNDTSDASRMDRSSSFERNERYGERRESVSALSASITEIAVEDQAEDRRNQSVPEAQTQERRTWDAVRVEENPRDSRAEPRPDEAQDDVAQGCPGDFYDAVRSGNVKRVSALIASGCVQNLDEPDWNVSGDPPLLVAATNQCLPVLSTLLANGCDPAVRSPRSETALHRVIQNGGPGNVLKFVEDLLKHNCPPNVKEASIGSTALHVFCRQLAYTPLKSFHHNFDAALKTLELLAKAGLVNSKDYKGRSPLHILASSMIDDNNDRIHIESLIVTLLDAGADTTLKNDRDETPLHESLKCGALITAELLISHTPTGIMSWYAETPLHIASQKNYVNMVTQLLAHGEDPGAKDTSGNTPLHLAAERGFHQIVSLLVTSPLAQVEHVNDDGLTALQVALKSRFINSMWTMLKAGADPSQIRQYCITILHEHPDILLLVNHKMTRRRQLAA